MQEVYKDGSAGEEEDFSLEKMLKSFEKENVDHVKVFRKKLNPYQKNITEAQLKQRSQK